MNGAVRIPLTLVTGFLGAGKTTLINRLLRDPALSDTAVIVNEFGEVGIDHLLVEEASDGVIELSDGCLCCTVRGALVDTLVDLVGRVADGRAGRLKRVVIETTGLADPVPVLQALVSPAQLAEAFSIDGVVTVVDALHGDRSLDEHEEARRQVAVADRLILTKADQAQPEALSQLRTRLGALAPGVELLDAGRASATTLIDCGALDAGMRAARAAQVSQHVSQHDHCHDHAHHHHDGCDHHHHHGTPFDTVFLGAEAPMPLAALEGFLDLLRGQCGNQILRLKGLVETVEKPEQPLVVQGVRQILSAPRYLERWPDGTRGVRLVVIGTALDAGYIRGIFSAFTGQARIDTPDRTALQDNPLAIAGYSTGF